MNPIPLRASVIIPTRGASPRLAHTLSCLAKQTIPLQEFEVIVVTVGAVDDVTRLAPSEPGFRLKVCSVPKKGPARKRNTGAETASADLLVFLDDDMAAEPGLLAAHLRAHAAGAPDCVVMGYFSSPNQPHAGWFADNLRDWWEDVFQEMEQAGRRFQFSDAFSGNVSLPAALFHQVGGFDPSFECHEDYELGLRLIQAGARFAFCRDACCLHQDETDLRKLISRKRAEGSADIQLARKHPLIGCSLPFAGQITGMSLSSKILRNAARGRLTSSNLVPGMLLPLLTLAEKFRLREMWQRLLGGLLFYTYWQGVFAKTRDWQEIQSLARKCPPASTPWIDLGRGKEAVRETLANCKPGGVLISWHGIPLGAIPEQPGAEVLNASHIEAWLRGPGARLHAQANAVFASLRWDENTHNTTGSMPEDNLQEFPSTRPQLDCRTPSALVEVELQDGVAGLHALVGETRPLRVLVRRGGRPLGWLHLDLSGEPYSEQFLVLQIIDQIGDALLVEDHRLDVPQERPLPEISVIICTRNRPEGLDACLRALSQQINPPSEIIVVDNTQASDRSQTGERAEAVAAVWKARYVREERAGLDFARNRGLQAARSPVVAYIDDDARPARDWTAALARAFARHHAACVTGFVAPAELQTREQCLFEWVYGGMGHGMIPRLFRRDLMSSAELLWASRCGVGTNMAFYRETLLSLGGFDPALDVGGPAGGGGDIEIYHRLITAGHSLFYEPAALVWHQHRRTWQGLRRQLFDNGRSFGAYLLTCAANHTVSGGQIAAFALFNWLYAWLFWRFFRPGKFHRSLVLAEMLGACCSPLAFLRARRRIRLMGMRE